MEQRGTIAVIGYFLGSSFRKPFQSKFGADNTYTYRYEIDSDFGTTTSKEYKTQTLVDENVEEIEDPNCTTPVIREYSQKAKRSIWTFALGQTNYKYIFYVPEGTISKDVKLN